MRVHVSGLGNVFMQELGSYVTEALAAAGLDAELCIDKLPGLGSGAVDLIVAPHEYCTLDTAWAGGDEEATLERCAVFNTEQPGTRWFDSAAQYCARAGLVLDINRSGVAALRERGIEAHYAPVGYHRGLAVWEGVDRASRDIDVVFMGDLNPRRSDLLAQYARLLADRRVRLLPTDSSTPVSAADRHFVMGRAKAELLTQVRLVIDLHRGPRPYFAWQRALPAFTNGAVVVTEPSVDLAPLRPFEHLVVASCELLPYYVEALLDDEDRRAAMALRAHQLVVSGQLGREEWEATGRRLDGLAERNAARPARFAPPTGARPSRRDRAVGPLRSRAIRPPPETVPPPAPAALGRLIKPLILTTRRLEREVARLDRRAAGVAAPDDPIVSRTAAWDQSPGDVSVVVTVHNYEDFVGPCLESVLASTGLRPEVVVVDDGSRDRSVARVGDFMRAHPELPVALVAMPVNRGLPSARNEGFRRARTDFVFLLDVDNLVYPRALGCLRDALRRSTAGFAYCAIEQFDEGRGLMSCRPWDPRRLTAMNYIDAMAMIRRTTWASLGGFVEGPDAERLFGWEDYDFWLACAERGIEGVFLPEILARYRVRAGSMISVTNLDLEDVLRLLRQRHPGLPWGEV